MKKPCLRQLLAFTLMWLAYACCYLLRKPLGLIKVNIQESFNVTDNDLGHIDLVFSLPYALVSMLFGGLGDMLGARLTLGLGLIFSALASAVISLSHKYGILLALLAISGASQSLIWPSACNILSTWFSDKIRTSLMGIFGTSLIFGSVISTVLTVYISDLYGWRNVFYIPAVCTSIIGVCVVMFGKTKQEALNSNEQITEGEGKFLEKENNKGLNIIQVLRLPIVPHVSIALFCTKASRNAILLWLPFYLNKELGFDLSSSGLISLLYEFGGFFGSIILTILIDKFMNGKDVLATIAMSFLSAIFSAAILLVYLHGNAFVYISLFLGGAVNSTADVILCGSLPTKIGEKHGAKSSVAGIINGIGSLGNVLEGPAIGLLSQWIGIKVLIPFIIFQHLLAGIVLLFAMYLQRKENKNDEDLNSIKIQTFNNI